MHVINLATLLFAVFLFVFVRVDRIPPAYVAVPVLILVLVVLCGQHPVDRPAAPARLSVLLDPRQPAGAGSGGSAGRWPRPAGLFAISTLMFAGWFVP